VLAWAQGRDVKALVSAGGSQARAGGLDDESTQFNARCRALITGAFAPADQRSRTELKKLVARQCHKPGKRLIVTIVPDWMQDQRGFETPKTKIIERHI